MPPTPTFFYVHALGASARSFDPVISALDDGRTVFESVPIDLPGFGDQNNSTVVDVIDTVDYVVDVIRRRGAARWVLVGHSMGGKIASIVAARTLAGATPLFGLAGVVLLAGSPPSPEPMAEDRRAEMLSWVSDGRRLDAEAARTFVDANVGSPLPQQLDTLMTGDVQRTSREAWIAWLQRGSREDWSDAVGTLDLPAMLVAGGADGDLGADAQRRLNGPVYPRADVTTLDGAGHLLPLERPQEVAAILRRFWDERAGRGPAVPADAARAMASSRTNSITRSALAHRAVADDPAYVPVAMSNDQLTTLRAVAARVVPQDGAEREHIDLAARLDAQLASGGGDGWRFASLPPDVEAYRAGLDALAGFAALGADDQDARLHELAAGQMPPAGSTAGAAPNTDSLSPAQLAAWFTDVRDDLIKLWVAHPASMARMGFDGYANGGDGRRQQGFILLGAGERELWEPTPGNAA